MDQIKEIFSNEGLLKQKLEGYEPRPQQEEMAMLVARTIDERKIALIEGATGVGKSFAYLVPIIMAGKKAVVTTSNKSLQDQLSNKDLPTLKEVLGKDFSWTVLKGRSNYFCYQFFEANKKEIRKLHGTKYVNLIKKWADESGDGDLEYFPFELDPKIKEMISCDSNMRHEDDSPFKRLCFAEKAKERVKSSQIILANHTLITLDISLRLKTEDKAKIFPDNVEVMVIDEAHTFERFAALAFSDEINVYSLKHFLEWGVVRTSIDNEIYARAIRAFNEASKKYLPPKENGYYKQMKVPKFEGYEPVILILEEVIRKIKNNPKFKKDEESETVKARAIKEGSNLIEKLKNLMKEDENMLRWSEGRETKSGNLIISLKYVPISVAEITGKNLFEGHTVICTSATLSTNGNFEFFREQLGVPEGANELIIDSPFDFDKNSMAYISDGSLNQKEELEELLKASEGRAFVLFTSYRDMDYFHDVVDIPYPKFKQSYGVSRVQLLEDFKSTPNAVLFATKSFWEGVDVKGEGLSLVVIHKIPFANPSDLIYQSKIEQIDKKYHRPGSHWGRYTIPDACLALKQGFGRLIRSKTDKGVYVLLDARVNYKNYKNAVIRTLPDKSPRTQKLSNVVKFFENLRLEKQH